MSSKTSKTSTVTITTYSATNAAVVNSVNSFTISSVDMVMIEALSVSLTNEDGINRVEVECLPDLMKKLVDWKERNAPSGAFEIVDGTDKEVNLSTICGLNLGGLKTLARKMVWIGASDDDAILFKMRWEGAQS